MGKLTKSLPAKIDFRSQSLTYHEKCYETMLIALSTSKVIDFDIKFGLELRRFHNAINYNAVLNR